MFSSSQFIFCLKSSVHSWFALSVRTYIVIATMLLYLICLLTIRILLVYTFQMFIDLLHAFSTAVDSPTWLFCVYLLRYIYFLVVLFICEYIRAHTSSLKSSIVAILHFVWLTNLVCSMFRNEITMSVANLSFVLFNPSFFEVGHNGF